MQVPTGISLENSTSEYIQVDNIINYVQRIKLENRPPWLQRLAVLGKSSASVLSGLFLFIENTQLKLLESLKTIPEHSHSQNVASLRENIMENRYGNVLPYDSSRLILNNPTLTSGKTYVNASMVGDICGTSKIIATQGPLPHTLESFWQIIWENNVPLAFMIIQDDAEGPIGCCRYWPTVSMGHLDYGRYRVTIKKEVNLSAYNIQMRTFEVTENPENQEKRLLYHIQLYSWTDYGVSDANDILKIIDVSRIILRHVNKNDPNNSGERRPILVHCSAGCGRTGTFCATLSVLELLEMGKLIRVEDIVPYFNSSLGMYSAYSLLEEILAMGTKLGNFETPSNNRKNKDGGLYSSGSKISPKNIVIDKLNGTVDIIFLVVSILRNQRVSMVLTLNQYKFIYEVISLRILQWQEGLAPGRPDYIERTKNKNKFKEIDIGDIIYDSEYLSTPQKV